MRSLNNYNIIILGDSLQLHLAAHYLSEELSSTGAKIIPVEIQSQTSQAIRHVFTPFTPALMPALKKLTTKAKIRHPLLN